MTGALHAWLGKEAEHERECIEAVRVLRGKGETIRNLIEIFGLRAVELALPEELTCT
jgi:hypothetical protein